jgi:RNA polymerase sigma-70 factor, ECF subfamily
VARRYAPPERAEDVAQDALLRAWRHRHRLRDREQFFAWLATIVRNEAYRSPPRADEELDDALADVDGDNEQLERLLVQIQVRACIAALEPRERELLRLRYEEDMTQSAIAQQLGISEGTIKVQLHRARAKLRRALLRNGYEEEN